MSCTSCFYLTLQCFIISLYGKQKLRCSAKHLLCSTGERTSYRFQNNMRVSECVNLIFRWTIWERFAGNLFRALAALLSAWERDERIGCSPLLSSPLPHASTIPTINTSTEITRPGTPPSRSISTRRRARPDVSPYRKRLDWSSSQL